MPLDAVLESLLNGFAGTLKWIGIVIVFGTRIDLGHTLNDFSQGYATPVVADGYALLINGDVKPLTTLDPDFARHRADFLEKNGGKWPMRVIGTKTDDR